MRAGKLGGTIIVYLSVIVLFLAGTYWGSIGISVVASQIPIERHHTIVIDAGHGGEDGGATSCTGKLESSFNLEISLRLQDLFHLLGYNTKMIRTSDQSIYKNAATIAQKKISDLKERVRITNEQESGYLVSIHQNTYSDRQYKGAQVFYAETDGSRQLAEKLQQELVRTLNPGSNRKVKRADGIYLMQHITCPGVLIECGLISNLEEEALLRQAEYQQKLCCVIVCTVTEFLTAEY